MAEEKKEPAEEKRKQGKKINKMSLTEIEKALEAVQNSQGGLISRHARALIRRKEILRSRQ
ncbi:MAG: hypothetical protein WBC70_10170 [Candidatus Aminicenantales bacterium]